MQSVQAAMQLEDVSNRWDADSGQLPRQSRNMDYASMIVAAEAEVARARLDQQLASDRLANEVPNLNPTCSYQPASSNRIWLQFKVHRTSCMFAGSGAAQGSVNSYKEDKIPFDIKKYTLEQRAPHSGSDGRQGRCRIACKLQDMY